MSAAGVAKHWRSRCTRLDQRAFQGLRVSALLSCWMFHAHSPFMIVTSASPVRPAADQEAAAPDSTCLLMQVIFDGDFDTSTGPDAKKLSNLVLTGGGNVLLGSPRAVDLAILPGGPQSEKVSIAHHRQPSALANGFCTAVSAQYVC